MFTQDGCIIFMFNESNKLVRGFGLNNQLRLSGNFHFDLTNDVLKFHRNPSGGLMFSSAW